MATAKRDNKKQIPDESKPRDAGHTHNYIAEAIKALTLVNGGAALASMAFWGQLAALPKIQLTTVIINQAGKALTLFAFGTILPIVAALCLAYYQVLSKKKWLMYSARLCLIGAIVVFFSGLWFGWSAVEDLGFSIIEIKPATK